MRLIYDSEENRAQCICASCLSFPRMCGGEALYCARGPSKCEIEVKQCICDKCPVYNENNLDVLYFCDRDISNRGQPKHRRKKAGEDGIAYNKMLHIKDIAENGQSVISSMGSQKKMPYDFDMLHFLPAQLYRIPLERNDKVKTEVCIGPAAKNPLRLQSPIMITGMSLGAVSINLKLVFANVASDLKIAFNSGEGGILDEELDIAGNYLIGQYCTVQNDVDIERLRRVAAIEIRFGQGAYPGWESYLPPEKLSPDIAGIRGIRGTEPIYSPAHHFDINNAEELKQRIDWIRQNTEGIPVGAKIGCGNIEKDIEILAGAGVDFIALDGFGGGTGATECFVRENVGLPIIAALPRAFKCLKNLGLKEKISLIASGGLRTSADFAKCLALGADAIYTGTAALIAVNCDQYRVCHTGLCPTGITTHKPELVKQLNVDVGIKKLSNFIQVSNEEIANFARIVGKNDISMLNSSDLVSLSRKLSILIGVQWLNGAIEK